MTDRLYRGPAAIVFGLIWAATTQAATVFVNPTTGNDANAGLPTAPFKTIKKALTLAQDPSNIIVLSAGTYSAASGERFEWTFGDNKITFIGNASASAVIDAGEGPDPVMYFGDNAYARFVGVTLQNMSPLVGDGELRIEKAKLVNFVAILRAGATLRVADSEVLGRSGFGVDYSSLFLTRVTVDGSGIVDGLIDAKQKSTVVADELVVHDVVGVPQVIDVTGGSSAELHNSSIVDSWGTDYLTSSFLETAVTIRVGSNSRLWLVDSSISGSAGIAVFGDDHSDVKIDGGSFTDNLIGVYSRARSELNGTPGKAGTAYFRNSLANWRIESHGAFAYIDDADFRGGTFGVQSYDYGHMSVSNSTFKNVSRPIQFEAVDVTQNSLYVGDNLYFLGNASNYASVTARCKGTLPVYLTVKGSTWRPNVQGADADGRYSRQLFSGVAKGSNFWLKDSLCKLIVD